MPKYAYRCDKCNITFEIVHSIKEKLDTCKECNTSEHFKRVPSLFNKTTDMNKKEQKTGTLVNDTIEEMRGDIQEYQNDLRQRKYES